MVGDSSLLSVGAVAALLLGCTGFDLAAQNAVKKGKEYGLTHRRGGDQSWPAVALTDQGGYVAWEGNNTDGDGLGISAQALGENLSSKFGSFRVNENGRANQEGPDVSVLANGGAVFVWQGGPEGEQDVFARFMRPDGTFLSSEIRVNSYRKGRQRDPAVASVPDGTVMVVWSSFGQDSDRDGVYGQRFNASGKKVGEEFQINQSVRYNQRTPAVAGLSNNRFAVVWISENLVGTDKDLGPDKNVEGPGVEVYHVEAYGRLYSSDGTALSDEAQLTEGAGDPCANPQVAAGQSGGFQVVWSQKNADVSDDSWDVWSRPFNNAAEPRSKPFRVNARTFGDQYSPDLVVSQGVGLVVWASLGQDGSWEGIYGRSTRSEGGTVGEPFQVNTTTRGRQIHPAIATNGQGRCLVVWSGFAGSEASFDLFAQRYNVEQQGLPVPPKPYVHAVSSSRLRVTWPAIEGYEVAQYELVIDGGDNVVTVEKNHYLDKRRLSESTHRYRLAYRLSDGTRSPLSEPVKATTWSGDHNFNGLPDDWEAKHWGEDSSQWPGPQADSDEDGASNLEEFLANTDPTDPESALITEIQATPQGWRLSWNTKAGGIYRVQKSDDVEEWKNIGEPRFATDKTDSIRISEPDNQTFFRVIRTH